MELVWEGSGAASNKRAVIACRRCRQRKKRCYHTNGEKSKPAAQDITRAESISSHESVRQETDNSSAEFTAFEPIHHGAKQPESILADLVRARSPTVNASNVQITPSDSQSCSSSNRNRPAILPMNGLSLAFRISNDESKLFRKTQRNFSSAQRKFLEKEGAFRILPRATTHGLLVAYLASIDEVIPIVDGVQVFRDYSCGKFSPFLIHAMCMVASKSEHSKPYLRLEEEGSLLTPLIFGRTLFNRLHAAMRADMEPDPVVKIQVLCLMHLNNDGPGGVKEASLLLAQAIHEAWSIKLHYRSPGRTAQDRRSVLWWCLRNFDKINSCIHCGPRIINDQDIDLPHPTIGSEYFSQTISLFTRVGDVLAKSLEVYRALYHQELTGIEGEFPEFSDLVNDIDINVLQSSHKDFFELCYHVAAMLSCRSGSPESTSYNRRLRSADRIQELTMDGRWSHLPPLPILPYAVSLSLTVAYRALLDSQKEFNAAYQDISIRCETLEGLSAHWWTARGIAALGKKVRSRIKRSELQTQDTSGIRMGTLEHAPFNRVSSMFLSSSRVDPQEATESEISLEDTTTALWTVQADLSTNLGDLFDDLFNMNMPMVSQETSFWDPEPPYESGHSF